MKLRSFLLLFCSVTLLAAETVAGLKWTAPAGWKVESAARPMRAATYIVGDAECAVYFLAKDKAAPFKPTCSDGRTSSRAARKGKPASARFMVCP